MKKLIAVLLAVLLVFTLAACGDDPGPTPGPGGDPVGPGGDPVVDPVPDPGTITVEIEGDSVVMSTYSVGSVSIVKFVFSGDNLTKMVSITRFDTAEMASYGFALSKEALEETGYINVTLSGKEITAELPNIAGSIYEFYTGYNKETLAAILKAGTGGNPDELSPDYRIEWSSLEYVPEGMPKLAEKVTTANCRSEDKAFYVGWNVMTESEMFAIKAQLEAWLGAEMDDNSFDNSGYMFLFNSDRMSVSIMYSKEQFPGIDQCSVSVSVFDW